MNATQFINDIPSDVARQAHAGTSFSPERRGDQERSGYAETLAADYANLQDLIKDKELQPALDEEFARYRQGYKERTLAHLRSHARCLSWMITGPSNFPSARNEKANRVEHKRLEELIEFRNRALAAIRKKLCPTIYGIRSDNPDALTLLQEKIAGLEADQARMVAANKCVRKSDRPGLLAMGFTEGEVNRLFEGDFIGRKGYASFELSNNSANINRLKKRLVSLTESRSRPAAEQQIGNIRIVDNPEAARLQVFFPGKPSESIRGDLKSNGFRWTPSQGCWQAYRSDRAMATAQRIATL